MASETFSLQAGPQLLGYFLNWALLGVLTTQVYLYNLWFPADRKTLKFLVYGMFIFESVQTGLTTAAAFDQYIYSDGNTSRVDTFPIVWFSVPIMTAITAAVVELFFAWRIYLLSHSSSYVLPAVIAMLALLQLGAGTAGGVKMGQAATAAQLGPVDPSLVTTLVGAAVNDVVIAIAMTILLLRARTGVARTDAIISRIIRLTVETGTVTATLAIVDVILVSMPTLKKTLLFQGPAPVITKLYANTLLVNLNNRAFVRRQDLESVVESIHIPRLHPTVISTVDHMTEGRDVVLQVKDSDSLQGKRGTLGGSSDRDAFELVSGGSMTFETRSHLSSV